MDYLLYLTSMILFGVSMCFTPGPNNALAMATGTIETRDMAKTGVIIGIVGLLMTFAMLWLLGSFGAFR